MLMGDPGLSGPSRGNDEPRLSGGQRAAADLDLERVHALQSRSDETYPLTAPPRPFGLTHLASRPRCFGFEPRLFTRSVNDERRGCAPGGAGQDRGWPVARRSDRLSLGNERD